MKLMMLWVWLILGGMGMHNIHISKSKIKYDPESQSFQLSVHIFLDDLEDAIKDRSDMELQLFSKQEIALADSLVANYINLQFPIQVNGEIMEAQWVGKEITEDLDAIWCYLEIPYSEPLETVEFDCNILQERFDDQQNVVIAEFPGKKKDHFLFPKSRKSRLIRF